MQRLDDQIDALERTYSAFLREDQVPRAAYAAMLTARGYGIKSESATAASWRTNAARPRNLWALKLCISRDRRFSVWAMSDTGMALIDEGSGGRPLGNELDANTCGLIFCWTIASCRDLSDVERAAQWTDAAGRWCSRESISGFPACAGSIAAKSCACAAPGRRPNRRPVRPRSSCSGMTPAWQGPPWLKWARCSDGWGGWRMPRNPSTVPGSSAGG